jgi:hypothetical protein
LILEQYCQGTKSKDRSLRQLLHVFCEFSHVNPPQSTVGGLAREGGVPVDINVA